MSVKEKVKKHSVTLALCGMLTAGFTTYTQYLKNQEDKQIAREDRYEIFVSDYQDRVECTFDSLRAKKCQ